MRNREQARLRALNGPTTAKPHHPGARAHSHPANPCRTQSTGGKEEGKFSRQKTPKLRNHWCSATCVFRSFSETPKLWNDHRVSSSIRSSPLRGGLHENLGRRPTVRAQRWKTLGGRGRARRAIPLDGLALRTDRGIALRPQSRPPVRGRFLRYQSHAHELLGARNFLRRHSADVSLHTSTRPQTGSSLLAPWFAHSSTGGSCRQRSCATTTWPGRQLRTTVRTCANPFGNSEPQGQQGVPNYRMANWGRLFGRPRGTTVYDEMANCSEQMGYGVGPFRLGSAMVASVRTPWSARSSLPRSRWKSRSKARGPGRPVEARKVVVGVGGCHESGSKLRALPSLRTPADERLFFIEYRRCAVDSYRIEAKANARSRPSVGMPS